MPKETPATESPASELEQLRARVAEQAKTIEQLRQRIAELQARLAKDRHNSSKPPSSDPPFRKPPPRSQRKVSGRKPGGQQGHKGATRALVDTPDHQVILPLEGPCECGRCQSAIAVELTAERRQVVELLIRSEVTEYRTVVGTCVCGRTHRSDFPEEVGAAVPYGPSPGFSKFRFFCSSCGKIFCHRWGYGPVG